MRILYGVVGEGMGHATRSRVVMEELLRRGHAIEVVASGRAAGFLEGVFAHEPGFRLHRIHGLHLQYRGNAMSLGRSVLGNLRQAPAGALQNVKVYRAFERITGRIDMVFSDFDSWAWLYAQRHGLPLVSIDNMQVIDRARHESEVLEGAGWSYRLAKAAVKAKLPGADHYLITSFFFPPVRKPRTTLLPPILRPEIQAARREPGEHILVYQTQGENAALLRELRRLPYEFRVYGAGRSAEEGNLRLRPFSQEGFIDDLRTARGVVAGGGFSLMSEAVHLGVPMLSLPIVGQFEQELNARYLERLGYGLRARAIDGRSLGAFLERIPDFEGALVDAPRDGQARLRAALDALLARAARRAA